MKIVWFIVSLLSVNNLLSSDKEYEQLLLRSNNLVRTIKSDFRIVDARSENEFRLLAKIFRDHNKINIVSDDIDGTALDCAVKKMSSSTKDLKKEASRKAVEILLEYDADPNIAATWHRMSAFHYYCAEHLFEYAELLDIFFERGADVNQKDKEGNSIVSNIFHNAIRFNIWMDDHKKELIKKIMQKSNVDIINQKNSNDETILSRNSFIFPNTTAYIKHILTVLLELGLNPYDKKNLSYINNLNTEIKPLQLIVKQEYVKRMPKWEEECKNYAALMQLIHDNGDVVSEKSALFKRLKNDICEWDVSKVWKIWWVLSKDAAAKREQEEITRLMNIEY